MEAVQKILFPYLLSETIRENKDRADTVIFFGTDFYNLPEGSNQKLFIERTNEMFAYIRKHFPGKRLLYQPHPNETDEYTLLELSGFEVGKRTIADLLLWEEAPRIAGVFASCSWAAGSAYAMGHCAGVFLDLLKDAIPDDAITGYRSYFAGFPDSFFIRSFDQKLPPYPPSRDEEERSALAAVEKAIGGAKTVWFLAADPAYGTRAALLASHIKKHRKIKIGLIKINHRRWGIVEHARAFSHFDEIVSVPHEWFSARPERIVRVFSSARKLRHLPIQAGDVIISFSHALFAENCILSWYRGIKPILMIESRWFHFTYEEEGGGLPSAGFHTPLGARFFNYVVEPLLGLYRTRFQEYADGRVLNIARYELPPEKLYDEVFVLVPPV